MTIPQFTAVSDWSDFPVVTLDEFIARFPDVVRRERAHLSKGRCLDDDGEIFRGRYRYFYPRILLLQGDYSVTQEQLRELEKTSRAALAVIGNLQVEDRADQIFYVSGDLHCGSAHIKPLNDMLVDGTIHARNRVTLYNEDDGDTRISRPLRLQTPYVFAWFYSLKNLDLPTNTCVFIMNDEGERAAVPNRRFTPML